MTEDGVLFVGIGKALEKDLLVRDAGKRRLDSDRKDALIERALHARKAKTIGALCQARDEEGAFNSSR